MTRTGVEISVIICAYTEARWHELMAAIASVQNQTYPALEIIVAIDHNPQLLERVRANTSGLVITENHEVRGLSGARNSGIACARGEIIAFLDDDAIAAPNWLQLLAEGYLDEQVLGVGGAIIPLWHQTCPDWFPEEFNWVVGCTYRGMPEEDAPVRNLIGCNMSLRRKVFETVGGFRIGRVGVLSVGQENDETELCIRIGQRFPEARLLYRPAAAVQHQIPNSRGRLSYFIKRCYSEGISKCRLGRMVGKQSSLASEKAYVRSTLPTGVVRGLTQTLLRFRLAGLKRATMIVAGLMITLAGYSAGLSELHLKKYSTSPITARVAYQLITLFKL